jgi:hypothetical protein
MDRGARRPRARPRRVASTLALGALLAASGVGADEAPADPDALIEAGRRLYEDGLLPSGEPLKGVRFGALEGFGREVACMLCHQRSGMGLTEGAVPVPPVTAPVLFRNEQPLSLGREPRLAPGMRLQDWHFRTRPPYDDDTLARAIRAGVSPTGHVFNQMMPRYVLSEADMGALLAYLHQLSDRPSPGVTPRVADFATVVAPGVDPAAREAFLGVLRACFAERPPEPPGNAAPGYQGWRLHLWQLEGPAESWGRQLRDLYDRQSVFALVSGLGQDQWGPVEQFCESNRVPCLFPNVEVPGTPTGGGYSFYFFKGVLLEAEVAARYLRERRGQLGLGRVVQISRPGGSGARAAAALRAALADAPLTVEDRPLETTDPASVQSLLAGLGPEDALVLWLREADLAALSRARAPAAGMTLVSAVLGGQDQAPLNAAWKRSALLVYPYDPPYRWGLRKAYNLGTWLDQHGLTRTDERLQGNTLAACNLLAEGMVRLRGRFLRDYLVERTENYPTSMGNAPAPQAFPRFSIGPGQRFTSKGAYIARFDPDDPSRLERVEDWIVP